MWLCRLKSLKTCSQQARGPGETVVYVPVQKLASLRPSKVGISIEIVRVKETKVPGQVVKPEEFPD